MPEPAADLTCREIVELVTGYLERTLPEGQRRRFEEHRELCPDCQTYLTQMRHTADTLGELREESLTPGQRGQLLAAFRGWRPSDQTECAANLSPR